ncbi:YicC/YloC family endoribonuclease [Primorskyibacter sp. S87]|uniref:YicC/YloC family endoribonuclease n=1 Tax=Primorskyibacter sp. S87 TaxID=3415126 RepID=UPI003C7E92B0
MIRSMTGFASAKGGQGPFTWGWELRSVNGKGQDLRLRIPDWLEGLEAYLRTELGKAATRGNITLNLRLSRGEEQADMALNPAVLAAALDAVKQVEAEAATRGVALEPTRAADLLGLRGVWETSAAETDVAPLVAQLKQEFSGLVADFVQMRADEGAALNEILRRQLVQVSELTTKAAGLAEARREAMAATLQSNLDRVLKNSDGADPDRVAQELALISVKADVTEELDRLAAHVNAARALLEKGGPIGRKFDFLMQEFNREANTLCSKSQNSDLTAVGLELKAVIDQMREQVQNVE